MDEKLKKNIKDSKTAWWSPIIHFLVHVIVGTAIFLIIVAFAVGLDVLVVHKLASLGVNTFIVKVLSLLADAIVLADSVCFVAHLIQSVLKAIRETFK